MTWRLDRIVSAFSEAAADPSTWNTAMDVVSVETASHGAILLPLSGRLPHVPISQSVMRAFEPYVSQGWNEIDPRYKAVPKVVREGIATDLDVMSPQEMRRDPYYQEFLASHKLQWSAIIKVAAGEDLWALCLQRTISQGPVAPAELETIRRIIAPISSAATFARALGFARAEGALKAFELNQTAALMLNSVGQILKINNQAQSLLGEDIMIANRRLRSRSKAASEMLERETHQVLWRSDYPAAPAIALPREAGRPIIACVLRADSVAREVLSPARAFILLVDPDRNMLPALADLSNVFGLTKSEGRLVLELQGGRSLSEAAARLNTTYETARTTLKQAFRKTGTSGQPDLLRLISKFRPARDR